MRLEVVHGLVRLPADYAVRAKVVTKTLLFRPWEGLFDLSDASALDSFLTLA